MKNNIEEQSVILTQQWVETLVVGMNLCPFAAPVVKQKTLRYASIDESNFDILIQNYLEELELIQQSTEQEIATTLIIMPQGLKDFSLYLDFVATCEDLLRKAKLNAEFQLASFHPGYLFHGVDKNDISHWTNRSPFPMIHIIREGQMSRVLKNYPDPESIPERNIKLLQDLGKAELIKRFPPFKEYQ